LVHRANEVAIAVDLSASAGSTTLVEEGCLATSVNVTIAVTVVIITAIVTAGAGAVVAAGVVVVVVAATGVIIVVVVTVARSIGTI
jgi:uncharacterized membrane protein YphA (DoxX/SURF4 family)